MIVEKETIHRRICSELTMIYVNKNHDYGDSFADVREKIPNAILVRLHDKLNRLDNLLMNEDKAKVKSESIDDTLMDLANYCIMELIERSLNNEVMTIAASVMSKIKEP